MRNTFIAIEAKKDSKYIASVLVVSPCDNLLNRLHETDIVHANVCETKRAAIHIANFWNEENFRHGNYPFNRLYPAAVH